ncbi:thiamine diphosphokinase Ecym_4555 [Eremothecium cymbalariae DBVPG|uniref:Thiamine pyrophosphokinase n=1 Tax=Eremothecium cymbalariae (strain CBS 270.75 / DBVPG 7215 / KCTC 17166 / NRRL Y-17582) TaxID=931890 RepID=G8JU87_ERECY|nr:hypothetical protein Ecym_4555 [Eremothecium cymbalariae DBVPG\
MGEVVENPDSIHVDFTKYDIKRRIDIKQVFQNCLRSCILILNQDICMTKDVFIKLWKNNQICVCADGGANRLYEFFQDEDDRKTYLPTYIVGDMDSLRNEVREYYRGQNVLIIEQKCQYSNDFMKSIKVISDHFASPTVPKLLETNINHVVSGLKASNNNTSHDQGKNDIAPVKLVVLNAIYGRFDHTIQSVAELYRLQNQLPHFSTYYLTPKDLLFLLPAGGTSLTFTEGERDHLFGNCGLLPLAGPCTIVKTEGLKWDVANWRTGILEGQLSTSNRFVGDNGCYINSDCSIVVNIELKWEVVEKDAFFEK